MTIHHSLLRYPAFLAALLLGSATHAQTSTPDGVVSAGGSASTASFGLSWTLGQISGKSFIGGAGQVTAGIQQPEGVLLRLNIKALLDGALPTGTSLMNEGLRTGGLIPLAEPYSALASFDHVGSGGGETINPSVLVPSGSNAIVDWVFVDLRKAADNATVVTSRSALLQRDGDIVELDGTSALRMSAVPGSYYVAVQHRNHLGVLSFSPIALSPMATAIDFTNGSVTTYGTNAQRIVLGVRTLWGGDVVDDGTVKYVGGGLVPNDRDPILIAIGGVVPTSTATGYRQEDVTLDGVVKYVNVGNDRDVILTAIGGVVPTAVRTEQLP